mmetsp:Transcript_13064/g.20287  ORF Transcript_13064/g.20287 Transcript_13064/m.20287 type:complete len:186 (+) Transcript_13064:2972-3529(+)|eukprot:CAMPEP_0170496982 /NCGR_PEP_ID=MMETSP0208-20121228/23362_1 /TAXON_ID=197538 /ORGANISM="Strombidium inclinatum, Strain S3" /LENGTH=185 /DNA_ID=CAMNT_0010773659 /DNA_START=3489 /DNA_END=4046 /DNA_ORIENTATION=+
MIDCQFTTDERNYDYVKDDPRIRLSETDKSYGKYLRIGQETSWDQNFYKMLREDEKKNSLTLVFEIFEKYDEGVDLQADNLSEKSKREFLKTFTEDQEETGERLYAYAIMKANNFDFTMRFGTYDLHLYKPPINLRKRLAKDIIPNQTIKITLQMPDEKDQDQLDEEFRERRAQQAVDAELAQAD